jgi:hypothetical protein
MSSARLANLALADPATWGVAALYSLQGMFFFKPQEFVLAAVGATPIYTLQSLLGPLFLGLFAFGGPAAAETLTRLWKGPGGSTPPRGVPLAPGVYAEGEE